MKKAIKHLIWLTVLVVILQWICVILPNILRIDHDSVAVVENQRKLMTAGDNIFKDTKEKLTNRTVNIDKEVRYNESMLDGTGSIMELVDEYLEKDDRLLLRKEEILREFDNKVCVDCNMFNYTASVNSYRCLYMPFNDLRIFFLIMSRPSNAQHRKALRESFLQGFAGKPVNYAFVIGQSEDTNIEQNVYREIAYFGDILKFDFIDSYENLTIKSISALKWASRHCQQARYIMKLDDDVWVNTDNLLNATKSSQFVNHIGGFCYSGAHPIREAKHKHFVAKEEYPDEEFPPYCNGPAYIMTLQTVMDIGIISQYVPYVHIEDVFIGICLKKLNYSVTHFHNFHRFEGFRHPCFYKSRDVFTYHQLPSYVMHQAWKSRCDTGEDYSKIFVEGRPIENSNPDFTSFSQRKTCTGCFKFRYRQLIDKDICGKHDNSKVNAILVIFTSPSNLVHRLTLRQTYLVPFKHPQSAVKYVFVMGNAIDSKTNQMVELESMHFQDIVKFSFDDSYMNLTLKTINSLNWVTTNCKKARYILKIDDDVWLNSASFNSLISRNASWKGIVGECHFDGAPIRIQQSKYYISAEEYPHYNYPPFCAGPSYMLEQYVAHDIVKVSPNVPFFPLEDVYLGLCLSRLHYNVTFDPIFLPYTKYQFNCWFKSPEVLTFHSVSPNFMREIWTTNCSEFSQTVLKQSIFRGPLNNIKQPIFRDQSNIVKQVKLLKQQYIKQSMVRDPHVLGRQTMFRARSRADLKNTRIQNSNNAKEPFKSRYPNREFKPVLRRNISFQNNQLPLQS